MGTPVKEVPKLTLKNQMKTILINALIKNHPKS